MVSMVPDPLAPLVSSVLFWTVSMVSVEIPLDGPADSESEGPLDWEQLFIRMPLIELSGIRVLPTRVPLSPSKGLGAGNT